MTERWFESADGLRLHYRDYAAGEPGRLPLLCLPGLTRNSRDFEQVALRLRAQRRVLCADLRGRGKSQHDPAWQNYHPGTYLGDIARLLADAGIERCVYLGTSLGGILTMLTAATQPGRVAAAILNDVGPEVDPVGLARIASYVGRFPPARNWDEAVTLVLRGATSDILATATFERMQREKPDLVRAEVPDRGHVPLLDEPVAVAAIDAFLATVP